ncbi:50S ribosomal protein L6 [Candidatus Parcubacteria bacterium]|nr:50S ribosomal protein L6 [Patescibacteria group bacterium]MBU4309511.1 50S ribosomal protein L6 [Patescibacteria group bacterium]MBU4432057.1 50S ribosomal protein L6 [Patescibacteria group bacterium]MBU4577217.1 50S ribosomal protein L6 [Patescibacteria group bacterium]MCG2696863.1 50S ribosomal protein L6 [Candidatus Parcubacteria bacterium]
MSRLGKLPIKFNNNTQVRVEKGFVIVKGAKGELKQKLHPLITVTVGESELHVSIKEGVSRKDNALWGLFWSLLNNMVKGVTDGFSKKLELKGVGYKIAIAGQKVTLNVGFSHPVEFILPTGIAGKVEANTITIEGIDKQLVGEISAQIRKIKKPEPYKGKGIKYSDEVIVRKEGKTSAKGK